MSAPILLDSDFIDKIILEVKSQGLFDSFRKECLADVDTQPAYQNLHSRVEDTVQRFLNRQVWTPDRNKNRLREDMRMNIIRAGFLESGVSRIVDQVVEQKMEKIQNQVEEILYKYAGIEKPKKGAKNNCSLEIDTTLLPTDLEQVSPDSDKKSESLENKEMLEEEIIDDDDFESPAFEPIEPLKTETACQNSHTSNLSDISGLTSTQDSAENKFSNKSEELTAVFDEEKDKKIDTALSQISSTQDNIVDITDTPVACVALTGISGEEAQMAFNDSTEQENNENKEQKDEPVFQFDLNKDTIEFTGTERKKISLDDSTNSGESEKVNQPIQLMEVDNIYENDTTDSSEMRMEIDLKDESTQGTISSSKKEENSQDSQKLNDKKHSKSDYSKDKSSKSHQHRYSSSSSKSKYEERERSHHKSEKHSHKKSSSSHERSSNSTKHHDRKSSSKSRTKNEERKSNEDDHHQEKYTQRRKSTDDDDSKDIAKSKEILSETAVENVQSTIEKSSNEKKSSSKSSNQDNTKQNNLKQCIKTKETKSSILAKYDYLKLKEVNDDDKNETELRGFEEFTDENKNNPWFNCMRLVASKKISLLSNNNYIDEKQDEASNSSSTKKFKPKPKTNDKSDTPSNLNNTSDETIIQHKNLSTTNQQQRYDAKDLYKPKFDFRRGRRGQINDEASCNSNAITPESN
ncbi:hypothetical protein PVAND_005441 [Polypedilum vanderplanki]|uniref:BOD1/SHG1 domain-containing protein n=1 Tax=Polypedilum vanderplanki TaxID=319348 RepID=A0A9J6BZZ5_POLVA|nr:hypothetical protein PVAND_005441 [Polypedilum vanderplanki]